MMGSVAQSSVSAKYEMSNDHITQQLYTAHACSVSTRCVLRTLPSATELRSAYNPVCI
jgi:hypothetical protein